MSGESAGKKVDPEQFNPTGTAFLLTIYFLLLVLLWIFMYFVEFIGGGPTILAI